MQLRLATMDDAQRLFDWRNDAATRAASHATGELVYADHLQWLAATIANPSRRLYVAEIHGVPVGTIRVDTGAVNELSWTVSPEHRGMGVGSSMVRMATEMHSPVRAEIKATNGASRRIAEKAGMRLDREANGVLHFHG